MRASAPSRPVAIVTGVGRPNGIAAGIAARLAAEGWDLGVTTLPTADEVYGVDRASSAAVDDGLRHLGARVERIEVDLGDADATGGVVGRVADRLGPVSALVLSHAESVDSDVFGTSVDAFDRHHAVNARAALLLIRGFAEQRPEREGPGSLDNGAIVALTSDHVIRNLAYGASKGSLDRVVLAAAGELAELGIRANLVNPGPIDTGWMDDAIRSRVLRAQPTGRLGTPADTAALVSFLVSRDSAWITGQHIRSDGGVSLG